MELQPITPDSLDDEALTDLIELRKSGVAHHASEGNKVQHAIQSLTLIALVELQQRRDADSSDPIYQLINDDWYDTTKEVYESVVSAGGTGRIVYKAPQPAPVMNDELYKLANHVASSKNGLPEEWQDWAEELESEIRRAAMLQAGNHTEQHLDMVDHSGDANKMVAGNSPVIGVDLASGPDRTVEVRYVAPPGYVMVPKEPTEAMINAWLSEVANWRGHVAGYKAALAAAPKQEVNRG
ncbi:hypothetical protein [Citrobacter braakii]|uniref:hypothetical protein n=1 Tax=Citrobacter braakii TaxID=57706 RepID=UPI002DBE4EE7|nr:hypothetical protein [Citrobacter braakii]MEB8066577.1 hypothetical protein [Citrobacter braakii]